MYGLFSLAPHDRGTPGQVNAPQTEIRRLLVLYGGVRRGDVVSVKRMDKVGIVVKDLDAAIEFFIELGLELSRFHARAIASNHRTAPVNSLGYLRVMFAVEDIDDTLARLSKLGATVVDEVVNYENIYRLCYISGPERILLGLAQQLGEKASRENSMERKS